jgi:transcriptional regulatory protein RtcR
MKIKKTVVLGLLGPVLDAGKGPTRWERWRPTAAVCQHEDLLVDRFELLHEPKFTALAELLVADMRACSPETEVRTHPVLWNDPWEFEEVYSALHDFAREYHFDAEAEDYLVHITTGTHVAQICLFLLTESHHLPAKILQTSPPPRQGTNSPGDYRIIDLDLSKYDRLASRFAREKEESVCVLKSGIETRNARFNELVGQIEKVAVSSTAPVLLTGPTGAGKSLLARRIYELKKARRQVEGPFVEVNCATLRGDAAMSALFGHVRGSFTGAVKDRPGLLRAADGGVLLLDEIGELGLDEQAMLLRALEEKRFLPVGADREISSAFQLIAGTNRDLGAAVRSGRFREDLLARIDLWTFRLPALRDRREDLEPNLRYELDKYTRASGLRIAFSKEAEERYLHFAADPTATWPGNFRDLNASVVRMATLSGGGRIGVETVDQEIARLQTSWRTRAGDDGDNNDASLLRHLDRERFDRIDPFDRVQLAEVIRVCRASRTLSEAGRRLFSASRQRKGKVNDADRLRKYLARFGLDWGALGP